VQQGLPLMQPVDVVGEFGEIAAGLAPGPGRAAVAERTGDQGLVEGEPVPGQQVQPVVEPVVGGPGELPGPDSLARLQRRAAPRRRRHALTLSSSARPYSNSSSRWLSSGVNIRL